MVIRGWFPLVVVVVAGCADAPADSSGTTTAIEPRCEDDGWSWEDGGEDTGVGMGDDMPLPITIAQVQGGEVESSTWVVLAGVVVTTPAADSEVTYASREMFVQDPAGGPFSGLRVVTKAFDPDSLLTPGDEVDIVGKVIAYEGFYMLLVGGMDRFTIHGSATIPAPTRVAIADLDPLGPDARQYEGVVVEVVDATVTDASPCSGEVVLDGTLRVDDRFAPGQLVPLAEGDAVASVRGVFVSASDTYEIAPPNVDDVR